MVVTRLADARRDIWIVPKDGEAQPFIESPYTDIYPAFSPDGRWVVYRSNLTGIGQV